MQIQVNTDDNVEGRDELADQIEAEVNATLSRYSDQITRHVSVEANGYFGVSVQCENMTPYRASPPFQMAIHPRQNFARSSWHSPACSVSMERKAILNVG